MICILTVPYLFNPSFSWQRCIISWSKCVDINDVGSSEYFVVDNRREVLPAEFESHVAVVGRFEEVGFGGVDTFEELGWVASGLVEGYLHLKLMMSR